MSVLAVLTATALVFGACGGGDDDDDGADATGSTDKTEDTAAPAEELGEGVTADSIKVAISYVDFECIKAFVDEIRVDQDKAFQEYIDYVNDQGGINGRRIEAVYYSHCPIPGAEPSALTTCTAATEDDNAFAVIGLFVDFSGDAQLCVAREHERILIANEISQAWIDESPPALILTPDVTAERRIEILMSLLKAEGTLDGKKVAVMAETTTESRIADAIDPALATMDVERGSDAVLSITGTDTTAAQAQVDSFIERWKSEGVEALLIAGLAISNKQFVEKIKAAMPDILLLSDNTSWLGSARDMVEAGVTPNPYDGMLVALGLTPAEYAETEQAAECEKIHADAGGEKLPPVNEFPVRDDGQRVDIRATVFTACVYVLMFADIAEKVGPNLNNDTWTETVDNLGKIELRSTIYASLHKGKYDASDTFRISEFDPTVGESGSFAPVTEIRDVAAEDEGD
jgi:hypothetical protein